MFSQSVSKLPQKSKIVMACFPEEFWICFAVAVPMAGYAADQVPHQLRPCSGTPTVPGKQGLARGRRAPIAWQPWLGWWWRRAAPGHRQPSCCSRSLFSPISGFFCLKSLKLHCDINESRLGVFVQCPWQLSVALLSACPGWQQQPVLGWPWLRGGCSQTPSR